MHIFIFKIPVGSFHFYIFLPYVHYHTCIVISFKILNIFPLPLPLSFFSLFFSLSSSPFLFLTLFLGVYVCPFQYMKFLLIYFSYFIFLLVSCICTSLVCLVIFNHEFLIFPKILVLIQIIWHMEHLLALSKLFHLLLLGTYRHYWSQTTKNTEFRSCVLLGMSKWATNQHEAIFFSPILRWNISLPSAHCQVLRFFPRPTPLFPWLWDRVGEERAFLVYPTQDLCGSFKKVDLLLDSHLWLGLRFHLFSVPL